MASPYPNRALGARRPGIVLLWLMAAALVVASLVVRFHGLGRQGYWSDELFTVNQSATSLGHLWKVGRTEIHTPFFALLTHLWIKTTHSLAPSTVRMLPAALGAWGAVEGYVGLRKVNLSAPLRAVLAAATACSGFAIVHSQDIRPYALLWTACVGATAATLRLVSPTQDNDARRDWRSLTLWGLLASASHLFGILMFATLVATTVVGRWTPLRRAVRCVAIASLPQVLWIAHGLFVPGFAAGAKFPAPSVSDVGHLVTTVFACGKLHMAAGGFEWRSWLLSAALGALLLLLGLLRLVPARIHRDTARDLDGDATRRALVVLWASSILFVVIVFVVSQAVHLWTTRNMVAVAPALSWAVFGSICALPRTVRGRLVAAWVCLGLVAATLPSLTAQLDTKYKTDYTTAGAYVVDARRADPSLRLLGNSNVQWATGVTFTPALSTPQVRTLLSPDAVLHGADIPSHLTPQPGDVLLAVYAGVSAATTRLDAEAVKALGGSSACHAIPVHGIVLVRCHRAGR